MPKTFLENLLRQSNVQFQSGELSSKAFSEFLHDEIKKICVDYTIISEESYDHAVKKIKKFYQANDRYLIIVTYGPISQTALNNLRKAIFRQHGVLNKNHISVMSIQEFSEFIKLEGNSLTQLERLQSMVLDALNSFDSISKFEQYYDGFDFNSETKLLGQTSLSEF